MLGNPVIYAQAPASTEQRAAAIETRRRAAESALATGAGELPTSTAGWIQHVDTFTAGCKANNAIAEANRARVGPLEHELGDDWRFGLELIRAGVGAAMQHQQARVQASSGAQVEVDAYNRLLTSFQVALTTFHAFGQPAPREQSRH